MQSTHYASLSPEQHDLLYRTGPGTAAGDLLRGYWQPAALTREVLPGSSRAVRILGQDLLVFRDPVGHVGALKRFCPHRGADLRWGRIERDGVRCMYHGWLFAADGRCVEQPTEPPARQDCGLVRAVSYPCREAGGMIFVYLGKGPPPTFPKYDVFAALDAHVGVTRYYYEGNYLLDLESNVDPGHVSFLHVQRPEYEQFNGEKSQLAGIVGTNLSANTLYMLDPSPELYTEVRGYGLRLTAVRRAGAGNQFVRGFEFLYPNLVTAPVIEDGYILMYHVPIDDERHYRYDVIFDRAKPVQKEALLALEAATRLEDGRLRRNRSNRYLQERTQMHRWFAGMGHFPPDHDGCVLEEAWPADRRAQESLGSQDVGVIAMREQLLALLGETDAPERDTPRHRDPQVLIAFSEVSSSTVPWEQLWSDREREP